jgi:Lamin Tail Domain/Secretion system C-terminal sorting domain
MKKFLLSLSIVVAGTVNAQNCTKIFISEYVEGFSNNKALEIYNPTASPVNLSNYFIARFSNGSATSLVENSVQLSGTIAPYSTFVAVIDQRDPNGSGNTAPVWDSLQAKASAFFCPVYGTGAGAPMYFNGDDAVALVQGTLSATATQDIFTLSPAPILIDLIGKIGERPQNLAGGTSAPTGGWSTGPVFAIGTVNRGKVVTTDHSLIRKSTITGGQNNPAITEFNPLLQWDSIPSNIPKLDSAGNQVFSGAGVAVTEGNWKSLGKHTCSCGNVSIKEIKANENTLAIYPNPSVDGLFTFEGSDISSIVIQNSLGQTVKTISTEGSKVIVNLNDKSGFYFATVTFNNGAKTSKRLIVR